MNERNGAVSSLQVAALEVLLSARLEICERVKMAFSAFGVLFSEPDLIAPEYSRVQ